MLSDSPVCLFAARVAQFDNQKESYFDAANPYYLLIDNTNTFH